MRQLAKMLIKRKTPALIAAGASGLSAAVTLIWNMWLSGIINLVSGGGPIPGGALAFGLIAMLVMGASNYFRGYISGYTCEYMSHDLRMGYARYFTGLPITESEGLNAGEQLSKLQNEITGVSNYINTNLFQLLDDGVRFLSTLIWLFFISPALTLAANLPVIVIMLYVFYSSKTIEKATAFSLQAKGNMNRHNDALLTLFPVIRLYEASRLVLDGYTAAVGDWKNHTVRSERVRARLMSLSAFLSCIPLLLIFLTGGHMVISGTLTVGVLYIFINLSGNVSGVMMNLPGYIAAFRQFIANMGRLEDGSGICRYL